MLYYCYAYLSFMQNVAALPYGTVRTFLPCCTKLNCQKHQIIDNRPLLKDITIGDKYTEVSMFFVSHYT